MKTNTAEKRKRAPRPKAVKVKLVVRARRPKKKCDHESTTIYTRVSHERNQYEWLCSKCGEVVKTESMLHVFMRQPSPNEKGQR